jgi:hypothetical protein
MEFTYDSILKWMKDYFKVYSTYGQDPKTTHRMNDYFAPDLRFVPYIAALGGPGGGFNSRDEFLRTAESHPSWHETLTPEDITVDERRKVAVVLFKMQVIDSKTGEAVVTKSAIAHYQLVLDENNTIKISKIQFFWEVLPAGVPEFYDLYGRG